MTKTFEEPTDEQMFENSGRAQTRSRLAIFLYDLMKDEVVPGKVEELVRTAEHLDWDQTTKAYLSNGWLLAYAKYVAARLSATPNADQEELIRTIAEAVAQIDEIYAELPEDRVTADRQANMVWMNLRENINMKQLKQLLLSQ